MKKNDVMGYLVYVLMIGIAVAVGFGVIRPEFAMNSAAMQGNLGIVFVLLGVLGGILVTALMLELGHLAGAKIGKYKVTSWNCLFFQFKKDPKGKTKFAFANFDGITGETKIVPCDASKSNPRHVIFMPLVFFLLEVVLCTVLMVLGKTFKETNAAWIWSYIIGVVVLTVGCMIFLYDIFPAHLDGKNDGYLIPILNNEINVRAYNEMLLAEDAMANGKKAANTPVYEEVTDFTARLNDVTIYNYLAEARYEEALRVNAFTIASKEKVSRRVYSGAIAQKTAIDLYTKPFEEAKEEYISLPLEEKKFIESLGTAASVRAYILISGLINDSINETKRAMDHADAAIKASGEDKRKVEERLMRFALKKVQEKHPDWDFSEYSEPSLSEKGKESKGGEKGN